MENINMRKQITVEQCKEAIQTLEIQLARRLNERGFGTLSSRHEIQGVLTEEYHEAVDGLRTNDVEEYRKELLDIAVACVFGVACIDAKTIDW